MCCSSTTGSTGPATGRDAEVEVGAGWWLAAPWQHKLPAMAGLVLLGAATYLAALAVLGFRPGDFSRRGVA